MATVSIPLRSIPVVFPEDRSAEKDKKKLPSAKGGHSASASGEAGAKAESEAEAGGGTAAPQGASSKRCSARKTVMLCGGPGGAQKRRLSLAGGRGKGGNGNGDSRRAPCSGDGEALSEGGGGERGGDGAQRRYRLHTLAGPLTNRTMDNGFVVMSLTLVAGGNDLLGEPDELDREDVKVRCM